MFENVVSAELRSGVVLNSVPNRYVSASNQGAFNIILNNFDSSGYVGTFGLKNYNQAKSNGYGILDDQPVVWFVGDSILSNTNSERLQINWTRDLMVSAWYPDAINVGADRIELKIDVDTPGFLVVEQSYYPGWKVLVDGVEGNLLQTVTGVMAVRVDQNTRTVTLWFRPTASIVSIYLTFVLWVSFLIYCMAKVTCRLLNPRRDNLCV